MNELCMVKSELKLHSIGGVDVEVGRSHEEDCDHPEEEEVSFANIFLLIGVAETQAHPFLLRNKRIIMD